MNKNEKLKKRPVNEAWDTGEDEKGIFQIIAEQNLVGIVVIQDDKIKYVNHAVSDMLGYEADEMCSWEIKDFVKIVHPEDLSLAAHQARKKHTVNGKGIFIDYQYRAVSKSGEIKWINHYTKTIRYNRRLADLIMMVDITDRIIAEDSLRESEEKYLALVEKATDGVVIVQDEAVKFANRAIEELTGFTAEELSRMEFLDLVLFQEKEILNQRYQKMLGGNRVKDIYNMKIRCKDGTSKDVEATGSGIQYMGKPAVLGIVRNITERLKAEKALRESEKKYSTLVEQSTDGVVIVQNDKIRFINRAITDMTGFSLDEVQEKGTGEFIHPADKDMIDALFRHQKQEDDPLKTPPIFFQGRIICKDGEEKYFEATGAYILYEGSPAIIASVRDITERKKTEDALKESQEMYSTLVEQSSDGVVIIQDGKVLFTNEAMSGINGYSVDEIKKHKYLDIVLPEYIEMLEKGYIKLLKGQKESTVYNVKIRCKDGTIKDIETTGSLVKYRGKDSIIVNVRDATERNQALEEKDRLIEQLRQSQKMEAIGRLAGGVAHDFNNLLTAITGYSDLILMNLPDNAQAIPEIKEIKKAAGRATSLTRQLLAFSRRQPLNPRVLDINVLIINMEKMLRRLIGEDIKLKTILAPDLFYTRADPGQIEQVLMNIIVNARDAMPEGGTLLIKTENITRKESTEEKDREIIEKEFICISIKDTGIGMDDDTQVKIFEPFFSTKGISEGTGLGLSVVYGIIKQHSGWIEVKSKPRKGTTFNIFLPSIQIAPGKEDSGGINLTTLKGNNELVLLVEDEDVVREFALRILAENGYRVKASVTAAEALKIFNDDRENFDLAVVDVVLPDRSGIYLVNQFHTLRPEFDVILCSGYTENKSHWSAIKERGICFLQKPYSIIELLKAVKDIISKKE